VAETPKPFAAPHARAQYARARTYDLAHLRLDITLDLVRRFVRGVAALRFAPLHDGLRTAEFDLAAPLRVAGVRSGTGRPLRFERDGDRLRIDLGRTSRAGHPIDVVVDYAGQPLRGLYFTAPDADHPQRPLGVWSQGQDEDSKHWFPCFDSPHDKFTSEVVATVPAPLQVISNGRLVATRANRRAGTVTYHWREDLPHPAYLVSIVAGEYAEVRDTTAAGVPISYYVHPRDRNAVRRTFGNTPRMLELFARLVDYPYPFEKYAQTVVADFIFGGMENVSATTLTDAVLLDATAALDSDSDGLIAHELAHQWWGNLLTCKEWSHAWLNEGFATYFEAVWAEHHRGRDWFRWEIEQFEREYLREDEERYRRSLVERRYTKPIELFDRHLYQKGALVLHMLRQELGDALFWKAIRHYARKHQFQNVETADFKIAIEEATGAHLDAFFDQWVYGAGFPDLEATWSWEADAGATRLQVRQTQSGAPFAFGLEIELGFGRRSERRRVRIDAATQTFFLATPKPPRWVRIDPDHVLLARRKCEQGRDAWLAQLATADFLAQAEAAAGLARFAPDADVLSALAAALGRVRFFAARRAIAAALGRWGGADARGHLQGALARERDLRARRGIVRALGEFRHDADVARTLAATWKREKSYFVRAEIAAAVARIAAPGAFEFLVAATRIDSFRDVVRVAALRGLAELEDERGIDAILPWARRGHSRFTRDAALRALAVLGRAFPARGRPVQDVLETALASESFFAVLAAAEALGRLGRVQAAPALRRLAERDVDGRLQRAARDAAALLTETATPDAWRSLRAEMDTLRLENRTLRERLDRVEHQVVSRAAAPRKRSG
jgi:aminopeptidase N